MKTVVCNCNLVTIDINKISGEQMEAHNGERTHGLYGDIELAMRIHKK